MTLPVTLEFYEDEAPIGLVARLAAANGFPSLRGFLNHTNTTASAIAKGDPDALALVSQWSGVAVERLCQLTTKADGAGQTWRLGKATFNKDMRPGKLLRYCPECAMADQLHGAGRVVSRAYYRAWWMVRGIEGCHVHDRKLSEVLLSAGTDIHDFPRFVEANKETIQQMASRPLTRTQPGLDRHLLDSIFGSGEVALLNGIEAHVAAEFSRYLGDFLALHDIRDHMPEARSVSEWGFLLACKGEPSIRNVVTELVRRNPPKGKRVETVLGPMILWLRRNVAKVAYQPIVNLVQDILERSIPFGPGETVLKPVVVRHLHSVVTAQEEFGLHAPRIRALMQERFPALRIDLPDGETYFDSVIAEPFLRAASETLTSKQTADLLGVTEARMQDLLDAGIVEQVEKRAGEQRAYTRITRSAVCSLEVRLAERLSMIRSGVGLQSLPAASRDWRRSYHSLVSMILDGTLDAFARNYVANATRFRVP